MKNRRKKQPPVPNAASRARKPIQGEFKYYKTFYWIAAIIVTITAFLSYLPAINNEFVNWDDGAYVYENNAIQSLDFGFLKWVFTNEVVGLWHPLTMFSFAVNYAVGGLEPLGYHLVNNLFHALNALLVFILSFKIVKYNNAEEGIVKKAIITGIVTALLFGMHPIHVESVAWVSERKDVLSTFFYLLSVLVYLEYVSTPNPKRKFFYSVGLIFFILALLSKPMAVSLPIVLLILDFYPLVRLTKKGVFIEKLPFFLMGLLSSLATLLAHYSRGGLPSSDIFPVVGRIFVAIRSYIFYLAKMVLPTDLAPFYPYPVEINYFGMEYLASCILLGAITFLCIWSLKRNKLFSVIWLYYIVTLLPVIGIIKVGSQAAADRYTYLPSIGPFLFAGLGTAFIYEKYSKKSYRIAIIATMLLVSSILVNKTVKQIAVWHDSITLWTYQIRILPDSTPIAYNNRGLAYDKTGNSQQAMKDYNKAIELNPRYGEAYDNRGGLYFGTGDYQSAMRDYNKAIELSPQYDKAYYNRGTAYNSRNSYQEAIEDFTKAIELNSKDSIYYTNRGSAYNSIGSNKEAVNDYIRAIELNPKDAYAYYNLGNVYLQIGNTEQAIINYKKAADLGLKEAQKMLLDINI